MTDNFNGNLYFTPFGTFDSTPSFWRNVYFSKFFYFCIRIVQIAVSGLFPFGFIAPKNLHYLALQSFDFERHPMKLILEIIIYFHSSQCLLIPYLHQRPIFFKANSIHSSIVAILELIRGAQCLIEVIRSSGEEM